MTSTEGSGVRVLLVDDDRDMTDLSTELFELQGVQADAVATISGAIEAIGDGSYDAVVTDLSVEASGDGLGLTQHLKGKYPTLVVVVVSGDPTSKQRALELGASAFFTKPADLTKVADFIRSAVQDSPSSPHP